MRYVTDLSTVKPEEILHFSGSKVISIYPSGALSYPFFVVCCDKEGRYWGDVFANTDNAFYYEVDE